VSIKKPTAKSITLIATLCIIVFALFLGACSKQVIIGNESDNALRVSVTNKTGYTITGVSMKLVSDSEFSEQLLAQGEQWSVGQTVSLAYTLPSEEDSSHETESLFDVQIILDPDIEVTLHAIDLTTIKSTSILYDTDLQIAYLEYSDKSGNVKNNLEEEKAVKSFEAQDLPMGAWLNKE
jgi:hypothetical protein